MWMRDAVRRLMVSLPPRKRGGFGVDFTKQCRPTLFASNARGKMDMASAVHQRAEPRRCPTSPRDFQRCALELPDRHIVTPGRPGGYPP